MTPTPFVVATPAPWLLWVLAVTVVAGAVALVVVRAAQSRPITGAESFGFYLRTARIVALLLILSGGAGLLKVGFAQVFGDRFTYRGGTSYWSGYDPITCSGSAGAAASGSLYCTIRSPLGPISTAPPSPPVPS